MSQVGRPIKGDTKRNIAFNIRIPQTTRNQIQDISDGYKVSQADIIIAAVDMMHDDLFGKEKGNGEV